MGSTPRISRGRLSTGASTATLIGSSDRATIPSDFAGPVSGTAVFTRRLASLRAGFPRPVPSRHAADGAGVSHLRCRRAVHQEHVPGRLRPGPEPLWTDHGPVRTETAAV